LIILGANVNAYGPRDRNTLLTIYARHGNIQMIKYLLDRHGIDINIFDRDGYSPLHIAVMNDQLDVVKCLVEYPDRANVNPWLDIDANNDNGVTAVHLAVNGMHVEIFKYLMDHGADIDKGDMWGQTSRDVAIGCGNANVEILDYIMNVIPVKGVNGPYI